MSKFKVEWQADDGYAGGARPQSFDVDVDDFNDVDPDSPEFDYILQDMVRDDFDNKVSWTIDNEDEIREWLRAAQKEQEE